MDNIELKAQMKVLGKMFKRHICIHDSYCNVKKTLNKAHCSQDYAKNCQTNKFYSRYGKDYDQLGVGC